MKKITKYFDLIRCLDSSEWQVLEKYLTSFSVNRRSENTILVLARSLRYSKECLPPAAYSVKVYGRKNLTALKQLAYRLKHRVLDVITSELTLENKKVIREDADLALIRLKRLCVQYQRLLNTKPDIEIRHYLLDEIIFVARKYEKYDVLLEHLHLKKWSYRIDKDKRRLEKIKKDIRYYEKCRVNVLIAADYVYELKEMEEHSGKRNEAQVIQFFERSIPHLKYLYTETPSPYVLYYLRSLELSKLLLNEEYKKARSKALEVMDVVRQNKSVYKIQRTGIVYALLAICEMHNRNFPNALEYARSSWRCYPKGHYNYAISKQYEFYALFFDDRLEEAGECAKEMMKISRKHAGDFRYEKFHYLYGCLLFKQRKFVEALAVLEYKTAIKEDKEGWEFSWKVLQAMCAIELERDEEATFYVKSLHDFMHYNKRKVSFSSRQKIKATMLRLLERYGFNGKEKDDEVKGLSGSSYDYGARMYDPRVGRFMSIDPLTKKYPQLTPYQFASNTPIQGVDLDGKEIFYSANGTLLGKYGTSTEVYLVNKDYVDKAKNFLIALKHPDFKEKFEKVAVNSLLKNSCDVGIKNEELNLRATLSTLKQAEAGRTNPPLDYNSWYGTGTTFTDKTYAEDPSKYAKHPGDDPNKEGTNTAAGAYQFTEGHYKENSNETSFSPENQDQAAVNLMTPTGYKAATSGDVEKIKTSLSGRWISLQFWSTTALTNEFKKNVAAELTGNSKVATPQGKMLTRQKVTQVK